jgi:adenosylcobinamide kinase/adenosylcobinamide-phosphate guanylyltransferase
MIFIFGGRCQGKLQYAKQIFGENLTVCDLKCCDMGEAFSADIIINIQDAVKSFILSKENPCAYFKNNIEKLDGKILIGNEIGCGIVPIDEFEREWRDETGWIYQFLTSRANRVDRVWAGIGQTLKNI